MITIEVNGIPYTDFMAASCTVSLETLANDFSFTASAVRGFPPFKKYDTVRMLVDGVVKVTGPITRISGNDAPGGHTVEYAGRDKTSDLIDSNINALGDISADGLTLKRLIELVISDIGSSVGVVDRLSPKVFNKAEDHITPQVGENAWQFIRMYAAKRQAILTSDGAGNVVITQSEPIDSGARLQKIAGAETNNIMSQTWEANDDKRFSKYIVKGQLDPYGINFAGSVPSDTMVTQGGVASDSEIPAGRQKVEVESQSYGNEELADRAKWAKQLAKARATRFNAIVKGHSYPGTGEVWTENTLVQVLSEPADITDKMLLAAATFSQGEGAATTTRLELVKKNVYTLDTALLGAKKTGKVNDWFTG